METAAYGPMLVAHQFIKMANQEGDAMSPLKLIKLVYIAHGWSLGLRDNSLINEDIFAWKYGPVVESLYHSFKIFGSQSISEDNPFFPSAAKIQTDLIDADTKEFLTAVWNAYKKFSALQLSTMTHSYGTPWYKVWIEMGGCKKRHAVIPNELIKDHYKNLATTRGASSTNSQ